MDAVCTVCGTRYQARRVTSKYCGSTCRTRASRAGTARPRSEPAEVRTLPTSPPPAADDHGEAQGPVERWIRAELEAAGWTPTLRTPAGSLGAMAIDLAQTQDRMKPGQNKAANNRELRLTMQDFRALAEPAKGDAVDEAADEQPRRDARAPDPAAAGGGNVRPFGRGRAQTG